MPWQPGSAGCGDAADGCTQGWCAPAALGRQPCSDRASAASPLPSARPSRRSGGGPCGPPLQRAARPAEQGLLGLPIRKSGHLRHARCLPGGPCWACPLVLPAALCRAALQHARRAALCRAAPLHLLPRSGTDSSGRRPRCLQPALASTAPAPTPQTAATASTAAPGVSCNRLALHCSRLRHGRLLTVEAGLTSAALQPTPAVASEESIQGTAYGTTFAVSPALRHAAANAGGPAGARRRSPGMHTPRLSASVSTPAPAPVLLQTNGQYALADGWCTSSHVAMRRDAAANATDAEAAVPADEDAGAAAPPPLAGLAQGSPATASSSQPAASRRARKQCTRSSALPALLLLPLAQLWTWPATALWMRRCRTAPRALPRPTAACPSPPTAPAARRCWRRAAAGTAWGGWSRRRRGAWAAGTTACELGGACGSGAQQRSCRGCKGCARHGSLLGWRA